MAKKKSRPAVGRAYARKKGHNPRPAGIYEQPPSTNGQTGDDEPLKTFEAHGMVFIPADPPEYKADCPFCNKRAFSVNDGSKDKTKGGTFQCFACGKSGNKYTFLQLYYDKCFSETTVKHYKLLAKNRKLQIDAFRMAELAYDSSTGNWLIPVKNQKGSMVNLRKWNSDTNIIVNTTGCKTHLYNLERLDSSQTIFLCEGEWDAIAMEWLLHENKVKDINVLGVPGANIFKDEWAAIFADKIVVILYDNDEAGQSGIKKAADVLRRNTRCRELHCLKWPTSYPEKFDIRDYTVKNEERPKRALSELRKMFEALPLHDQKSTGVVRNTFDEVVKDFSKHIYLSQDAKDAMLLMFSVIFSNQIFPDPYCPLWLFLVAPPGGGKTMLLQSAGDTDAVEYISTLTPRTLVSGFKTTDGSDMSLLPKIIGKTLIIKDFTGVMALPSGEQDEIYAVLRDAYDGRVEKSFGHIGTRVYPEPNSGHDTCHFSLLAGVTGAVHADRRANHGERFLKYQMMAPSGRDAINQIRSAISNTIDATTPEIMLRESASSFIESKIHKRGLLPKVPDWVVERVIGLGQIVSTVRAVVMRKQGELVVRPESEVASRISKQIIKLGQAVAFTLDKSSIDDEVYRIMQRVGLDTCYGWHRDIIMTVAKYGKQGALRDEIMKVAEVGSSTTHRCLEDLFELRATYFTSDKPKDGAPRTRPGQPPKRWFISPFMVDLFKRAKIDMVAKKKVMSEIKQRKVAKRKRVSASKGKSPFPRKRRKVVRRGR